MLDQQRLEWGTLSSSILYGDRRELIDILIAALPDAKIEQKIIALNGLAYIGQIDRTEYSRNPDILDMLYSTLQDKNSKVQVNAMVALAQLDDPRTIPILEPLIMNRHAHGFKPSVTTVIFALGWPRHYAAVDLLIKVLADKQPLLRCYAVTALGKIEDKRANVPLLLMLSDATSNVRLAAIEALEYINDASAVKPLSALLTDKNPKIRAATAKALGTWASIEAISPLVIALQDKIPEVRWYAVGALGRIGDESVLSSLQHVQEYDTAYVTPAQSIREAALQAITKIQQRYDYAVE